MKAEGWVEGKGSREEERKWEGGEIRDGKRKWRGDRKAMGGKEF